MEYGGQQKAETPAPLVLEDAGMFCVFIILGKETKGEKSCTAQLFTKGRQSREDFGE